MADDCFCSSQLDGSTALLLGHHGGRASRQTNTQLLSSLSLLFICTNALLSLLFQVNEKEDDGGAA